MKITTTLCLLFTGALLFSACNSDMGSSGDVSLDTTIDSVSYSIGYQMGTRSLKPQGMTDIETQKLAAGIKAALEDQDSKVTQSKMQQVIRTYQMEAQRRAQEKRMEEGKENAAAGEEFLAENKNKEGVKVTDSGLQYKVIEEGSGVSPDTTDQVKVHYKGTLIDGTEFDSSYKRGEPVTFPLNRVIPGWTEGLQLMKEGATYKFFIPGNLAYGQNPPPQGPIGPNETLIFEVKLLEVNPEDSSSASQ